MFFDLNMQIKYIKLMLMNNILEEGNCVAD